MLKKISYIIFLRGIRRGRDHMVVWFTTTCAISQCLSPQKLWVWTPSMARFTWCNIIW